MSKYFETVDEVLVDESFLAWYRQDDKEKAAEWEKLINEDPVFRALSDQAVAFLQGIAIPENSIPGEKISASLDQLTSRLDNSVTPVIPIASKRSTKKWWVAAAAITAAMVISGLLLLRNQPAERSAYISQYGQLEKYELPDGSVVTLNANSSVEISKGWDDEKDREVWLKGEAFFKVVKTKNKNRFIVHTGQLDVIVTGTQFNVIDRGDETSVLLMEGSVTIVTKDGKEIKMVPGDFVELDQDNLLQKKEVSPENITAWTDKKIVFENTGIDKAAEMIKDIYGVEIVAGDATAKNIVLTGVMPNDNLDVLLQSIEASMSCKITREGNKIIITAKQ